MTGPRTLMWNCFRKQSRMRKLEATRRLKDGEYERTIVSNMSDPGRREIKSIQDGLLARLAENGLLEAQGLEKLSPTAALSHQLGEPLLVSRDSTPPIISMLKGMLLKDKISAASKSHLPSIAHVVLCSPKAARSLSSDLMAVSAAASRHTTNTDLAQAVRACPQVAPPDNLFANLAAEPALLSVLRNVTDATVWMRSFESHLLQEQEELASRTDDPQGSLTRFGEGVLLVEAFVSDCKVCHRVVGLGARLRLNYRIIVYHPYSPMHDSLSVLAILTRHIVVALTAG